jgi:hypothetical protein
MRAAESRKERAEIAACVIRRRPKAASLNLYLSLNLNLSFFVWNDRLRLRERLRLRLRGRRFAPAFQFQNTCVGTPSRCAARSAIASSSAFGTFFNPFAGGTRSSEYTCTSTG